MAWLPKTLSELPFILVGPILRKVTPDKVSVFVVTKENCDMKLRVYQHNGNAVAPTLVAESPNAVPVKQIGTNMFIRVITVQTNSPLVEGITYGYNITFTIGTADYHFGTISNYDSITNIMRIGMSHFSFLLNGNSYALPTFVMPSLSISKIRILHGSCRKPHGEGPDAMEQAYKIIYNTANNSNNVSDPTLRRPQMLFLTGDQIYADDVSDTILYMIDQYAQLLVGWDEDFTSLGCTSAELLPGKRGNAIVNTAKFSVEKEDAGSHLMKFREFVVMYCLAWSNTLWNWDTSGKVVLPAFADVYPTASPTKLVTNTFPSMDGMGSFSVSQIKTDLYVKYEKECDFINLFFQSLNKNFRTILANIPSYMIFDDHEVTDDFLFNGKWFNNALGNSLGTRICTNAMTAYALFQDWGNKPEDYSVSTPGSTLLSKVLGIAANPTGSSSLWNDLALLVLPQLQNSPLPAQLIRPSGGMNWNYYYEVSNVYEFLVLNTRSLRVFNGSVDAIAGLLSENGLNDQIALPGTSKTKSLIFVISPTPVIGVNYLEDKKVWAATTKFGQMLTSKEELDLEIWSYDKPSYEHFFSILFARNPTAQFLQVVLLGGDVHYAYSSQMLYWAGQPYKESAGTKRLAIASLCASSFKNEVTKANAAPGKRLVDGYSVALHDDILEDAKDKSTIYGWQNLSLSNFDITIPGTSSFYSRVPHKVHFEGMSPATFDRNRELEEYEYGNITSTPAHDWHYRTFPMKRINPGYIPSLANGYTMDSYASYTKAHREAYQKAGEGGKYIVGFNNMGDVMIEPGTQGAAYVYHQIWWACAQDRQTYNQTSQFPDIGNPYTIHKIDVGLYNEPDMSAPNL